MSILKDILVTFLEMLLDMDVRVCRLEHRFRSPMRQTGRDESRRVSINTDQSDHQELEHSQASNESDQPEHLEVEHRQPPKESDL